MPPQRITSKDPNAIVKDELNFTKSQLIVGVEKRYTSRVNQAKVDDKNDEYASQKEGMIINMLSNNVLNKNPANSLYTHTMMNFHKAYSQAKRAGANHTDCSYFVSAGINQMVKEMSGLKDDRGRDVFNESDLRKTIKAIPMGSTTSGQDVGLANLYREKGLSPMKFKGDKFSQVIGNEIEVGKVLIMDKDGNSRTTDDRHVWVSVRNPQTNKIEWAESQTGYGVILSTPKEVTERNGALKNAGRHYVLYDPFVGDNRKALNELDKQQMTFNVAYQEQKEAMNNAVKVSGGSKPMNTNHYEGFNEIQRRLMGLKDEIQNLDLEGVKAPTNNNGIKLQGL